MARKVDINRLSSYWTLYLFVLPSVILVGTFAYFPALSAFYHSLFRWNGDYISLYIGFSNFRKLLGVPSLWIATLLMLVILFKKINSPDKVKAHLYGKISGLILTQINICYIFIQGSFFKAPESIISSLFIALLIWGVLIQLAYITISKDSSMRTLILGILWSFTISGVLRSVGLAADLSWSITIFIMGFVVWFWPNIDKAPKIEGLRITQALLPFAVIFWTLGARAGGDAKLWGGFTVISILVVANILKMLPSIITAVVIHRLKSDRANYWYKVLFVVPMIIPGMVNLLIWKFFFTPKGIFNLVFLKYTGIMNLLIKLDATLGWGGLFSALKNPVWLGNEHLVLPAMIFWGFPWVGVVGVLIYLAGLQSIDTSTYEAADLDGVGPVGKFFYIELPLILTQVRINLVLLIIGTLRGYEYILILFDDGGGPNGRLMVPGLYMFRSAFREGYAGYACAIGLVIFIFILILTELNNRFVRVEK